MSHVPRVSIILAVHNGERYLSFALESVLGQSFGSFELLVVDDGSTDGTRAVIDRAVAADARVRAFHIGPSGRAAIPRNLALAEVRGEFVTFIDHDDWWEPDRLMRMVDGLEAHPGWVAAIHDVKLAHEDGSEWIGTWFHNRQEFNASTRVFLPCGDAWHESGPEYFPLMCRGNMCIIMQSVFIARHRLDFSRIRFDADFRIFEDYDLWMQLVLMGRFGYLDRVLAYYRQHPGGISRNLRAKAEDELLMHHKNYPQAADCLRPDELAGYRAYIAELHGRFAWTLESAGEADTARVQYRAAARWSPSVRTFWRLVKSYPPMSALRALARSSESLST